MSIDQSAFKFLFIFSSDEVTLVEIKRMDQPQDAPLSSIYKWLVIENNTVTKFTFKSMTKLDKEYREFEEGKLEFDNVSALLTFRDKQFRLQKAQSVSNNVLNAVLSFES
jgi:hypothetical protein